MAIKAGRTNGGRMQNVSSSRKNKRANTNLYTRAEGTGHRRVNDDK